MLKSPNWRLRYVASIDVIGYVKNNFGFLQSSHVEIAKQMLFDPELEVRTNAGKGITHLFSILPEKETQKLIEEFKGIVEKERKQSKNEKSKIQMHGAILGLIAIIKAHEALIEEWFPPLLAYLAKFKSGQSAYSDAVRVCLTEFWERYKIVWEYEKGKFTEEQIEEISEHINPYNYFA